MLQDGLGTSREQPMHRVGREVTLAGHTERWPHGPTTRWKQQTNNRHAVFCNHNKPPGYEGGRAEPPPPLAPGPEPELEPLEPAPEIPSNFSDNAASAM